LLKDFGCSSNTYRVYKTFDSDDLTSKYNVKFIDWSNFYGNIGGSYIIYITIVNTYLVIV